MNYIFVGSVYPKYLIEYLLNAGLGVDFAANNYQSALLEGFLHLLDKITIVSSPSVRYAKKCETAVLKGRQLSSVESGYLNFQYVGNSKSRVFKMVSELLRIRKGVKQSLNPNVEENIVCCYSLHSPFLLALLSLRKKIWKICVVIPDLPEYMTDRGNWVRKTAKKVDRLLINYCVKKMDCFVLLSSAMAEKLPINNKQWVVIEGIYRPREVHKTIKSEKKTVLYTGQLKKRYGIFDLVEAFIQIPNDNYELWLCGGASPNEMQWLEAQAEKDPRIKLIGRVSSEEVAEIQQKATLLVNPRHSNEEFTRYSFPSKTMEYLASGTPTLMCKLPSIPEDYYEYLFFFEDETINGMKNKIIEVCQMDEDRLCQKGTAASLFIRTKKNPEIQVKKIVEMLK